MTVARATIAESAVLIGEGLTAAAETVSSEDARLLVDRHYDFAAKAQPLAGEKDSNFHLIADDGGEYLLKIVHSADDPLTSQMHTEALLHVERRDPDLPVQRVVHTRTGQSQFFLSGYGRGERLVRMVTFSQGKLQSRSPKSPTQRRNLGRALARLQLALQDFEHPGADHESAWDMRHAESLASVLPGIEDGRIRGMLEDVLGRFRRNVAPKLGSLRSQVVHNDFSGDNVLIDPAMLENVTGILDFGDMVRTAVAIDAAVGAAYHLEDGSGPLRGALDFLGGFSKVRAFLPIETDLLFDLVLTRMLVRIAITHWRADRFPENREYILRNTPAASAQLERLLDLDPAWATDEIRSVTSLHPEKA